MLYMVPHAMRDSWEGGPKVCGLFGLLQKLFGIAVQGAECSQ